MSTHEEDDAKELAKLQDPDAWDWENSVVVRPSRPHPGAQVLLDVGREDFQRIAGCAERHGEKLTDFILAAARERVQRLEPGACGGGTA